MAEFPLPDTYIPEDKRLLDELDRSARAYGWEIGAGRHPMTEKLTSVSDDNPFMQRNWRDHILPSPKN